MRFQVWPSGGLSIGSTYAGTNDAGANNVIIQGNLGINQTSPTYKLDVTGLGHFTGLVDAANFVATSTTATTTLQGTVLAASGGNVGIGNSSPSTKVQISGAGSKIYFDNTAAGSGLVMNSTGNNWVGLQSFASGSNSRISLGYTSASAGTNITEVLSAVDSGLVGIGNTSPTYKLDVTGLGHFTGLVDAANFVATSTSVASTFGYRVGIQNSSPSYPLDVAGFINTDQYSGYKQAGNTILYATTTTSELAIGASSASAWMSASSSIFYNIAIGNNALATTPTVPVSYDIAIGYNSLNANTTGGNNTAIGAQSLAHNTTGSYNSAFGQGALAANTTGIGNFGFGASSLANNTTGSYNATVGGSSLNFNTTGSNNTGMGDHVLFNNVSATNTVAIGYYSSAGNGGVYNTPYNNQGGTTIGYQSGYNFQTGSDYNTLLGYQTGYNITTGAHNTILGYSGTSGGITTGSDNILIGDDVRNGLTVTSSNQLNIGNLIFSNSVGTGSSAATGNLGVGTSTPWRKLSVTGTVGFDGLTNDTADQKTLCLTANNEVVSNSGSTCITSSQRFKNSISPLDDASGLAEILKLNPVSFHYNDNVGIPGEQVGFIAEQVQQVDPRLVVLDASGTPFTVRYEQLTSLLAKAIQQIATITGAFKDALVAWLGSATNGLTDLFAKRGHFDELCMKDANGETCLTRSQVDAVFSASAVAGTEAPSGSPIAVDGPPIIAINGNATSTISVGDQYADLGATITGPKADLNLGVVTLLDGATTTSIQLDTSVPGTHKIEYTVTDAVGLAATATRIVVVSAPASSGATDTGTSTPPTSLPSGHEHEFNHHHRHNHGPIARSHPSALSNIRDALSVRYPCTRRPISVMRIFNIRAPPDAHQLTLTRHDPGSERMVRNLTFRGNHPMIKRSVVAVAAAATTLLALSATVASAQDWRRGTFEERRGEHRFGERCLYRVVATGFAHVNFFGGGDGVAKAEGRAVRSWEVRVSEKYGRQFGEFRHAQGKENKCERRGQEIECIISAHPCRER